MPYKKLTFLGIMIWMSLLSALLSFAQAVPINFVTNVDYNPHGQIIKVEYGNGVVTNYTYHSLNLRLQRIHTVNSSNQALQDLNYTYDSAGNIISITDAVNTATQSFQYDALNRLTQAVGALYGTKIFVYDQIGNILQKDGLNYAYGENGAGPHAVTSLSDGTTYQYDLNGNMIKKTKPTEVTDYTYDVENRLVNVKKNTTLVAEYFYDGDGGRVGKIDYTQTGQSGTCFLAGTQILMADGSARPIEKLVIGDEVIGFDEKLMKKVSVKVTQVFNQETAYDYLLINGHMKVTANHKVYTEGLWKEIGNMKLGDKLLFADLGEHTIKSFEKIRSNEGVKVYNIEVEGVHNYFANGYLVHNKMVFGSQTTGKVTKYLGSLYENVDGQEVRYIFLGSTRVASINAGKIYYYHDDHLGGTNVLSNNLGAKTELMEYLPFGGYAKHEKYGSSAEVAYYYFTGKPLDDETGLYYFGARYYDPQLGRFITADSIVQDPGENPQTFNRYSYCGNNPVNYTDPTGHFFWAVIAAVVKAVTAAATAVASYVAANAAGIAIGAAVGGAVGGVSSVAMGGNFWQGAGIGALSGGIFAGLSPGLSILGDNLIRGITLGGVTGPLTAGASMVSNFGSAFLAGASAGAVAGAVAGTNVGDTALLGGVTAGAFSAARDTAKIMRANMLAQSKKGSLNGGNGKSVGMFGDGKKLGGGRHDPARPYADPSPLGGHQGQQGRIGFKHFGFNYSSGSIPDRIVETWAGPHDFLNSWSYDNTTGYIRNLNGFERSVSGFTNVLNVGLATPIALPSAVSPIVYPGPGIIYGQSKPESK